MSYCPAPPPMTDPPPGAEERRTAAQIAADLRELGVREGDALLVHSSLSSMGHVVGGPETVVRGLLDALGASGTLLMPALSYEHVTSKQPIFDLRHTPSNVGAIAEHFRRRPGTQRSLHPTHSVCAVGPRTTELLSDHAKDRTPCGDHSPFRKLPQLEGRILMLGCGLRPNTSFHAIEERVVPPYLFGLPLTYVLIDRHGNSHERTYTRHSFRGWIQRYDRIAGLLASPALVAGHVLEAESYIIDAHALWKAALAALRRDPLYFVEPEKAAS